MTTKVAWLISIVFCTLNTFANAKPTVRTYIKLDNWINNCKQYKTAYINQSGNATKLSKVGQPKQRPRIWLLNWHDLSIPIPAIAYKHFDISPTGLKLSNHGKGISIKLVRSEIDSLEYLKTTKLYESFLDPEKNGKAAWKYFFGKPMNYSQFLKQSYLHTPDELNCKPETVKSDLPILSYLIKKKTIGSNDIAYPVAGIANAFVLESSLKNSIAYSAHITSPKEKNRVVSLEIYTNKADDFNGLGTYIGLAKNKKHSANPGWLVQLQKSLDSNKPEDWKKLSSVLPGSGFDRQSAEAALLWGKVVSAKKKLNFQSKPKQAVYIDPSRWLEHCIFSREKFATLKEKKIKFINAKKPAKPVKLWKLLWNDVAIPVPAGHYDTIIVGSIAFRPDHRSPPGP